MTFNFSSETIQVRRWQSKIFKRQEKVPDDLKFYTRNPTGRQNKVLFRPANLKKYCHLKKLEREAQVKPSTGRIKAMIKLRLKNFEI